MKPKHTAFLAGLALFLPFLAHAEERPMPKTETAQAAKKAPGLYAIFQTNLGDFTVRLFPKDAPKTVANFVGLAEGTKEFTDPQSGKPVKRPLYDGLTFHRVIPDFMIQGGDPMGDGRGGPGYRFEDEFQSDRKFDKPGILAMANAGPNTNGSQFFITVAPTPWLNGHHTIFGEVIDGYDVVQKISLVPQNPGNNRPLSPVTLQHIAIEEWGPNGPMPRSTSK